LLLAIDCKIEHCKVALSLLELKPNPNGPDVLTLGQLSSPMADEHGIDYQTA